MAISARLLRALHQRLGRETAESLTDWMRQVEASRADMQSLRDEIRALAGTIEIRFAQTDAKIERHIVELDAKIEHRFADLLKWSFVFWVGAVGAIAVLAGVLRR